MAVKCFEVIFWIPWGGGESVSLWFGIVEYVFVLIQTKRTPYGVTIVLIGPPLTSEGKKGLLPLLFNFWRGLFWEWCKVYV